MQGEAHAVSEPGPAGGAEEGRGGDAEAERGRPPDQGAGAEDGQQVPEDAG